MLPTPDHDNEFFRRRGTVLSFVLREHQKYLPNHRPPPPLFNQDRFPLFGEHQAVEGVIGLETAGRRVHGWFEYPDHRGMKFSRLPKFVKRLVMAFLNIIHEHGYPQHEVILKHLLGAPVTVFITFVKAFVQNSFDIRL